MSAERDAFLKTREDLRIATQALRETENAAHLARTNWERAQRRWDDLRRQLGELRMSQLSAGGQ
jgi:hypothetical protein